ncbi:MAG TPA: carbohydrate ABC transporter permease [Treponemataceae bacterium]|jgi:arabinosaccharide transport system permease protein|nr:carbohydrate ABC transporter permease [Treponema sp.]OQB04587.1 MAG: L-arabinose transport system permease protein AraQ [Spirochaetes bacterium ADurb.Bin215]HOU37464.1 carbohydrate ABC transporter permease [Treponemataceae bacterium]HPA09420.1 carbohydrate ABC transporter permease [Treponemataceae bacterium]HRR01716.1 carbohydrate ABC transporter permease [Treponemataceae bacterium]
MTYHNRSILIQQILKYMVMVAMSVFALAPFLFLLLSSLRPGAQMVQNGLTLDFDLRTMSLEGYRILMNYSEGLYFNWYTNSVIITIVQTCVSVLLSSMVGYALAVYDFRGRNLVFTVVLAVMMIPVEILILPLFKLTILLKIIDTKAGVILPFAVSPFAVFFFRQYSMGIPKDLIDSGRIDGCNELGIFFRIITPVLLPAFGAIAILQAMGSWNSFLWPLIVLRSNENLTLPIGLQSLLTPYGNNYDVLLSGSVLSIIPIIIVFLLNQKAFITGLTVGSVKG